MVHHETLTSLLTLNGLFYQKPYWHLDLQYTRYYLFCYNTAPAAEQQIQHYDNQHFSYNQIEDHCSAITYRNHSEYMLKTS